MGSSSTLDYLLKALTTGQKISGDPILETKRRYYKIKRQVDGGIVYVLILDHGQIPATPLGQGQLRLHEKHL